MIWRRKPKAAAAEAPTTMMEAIASGRGRGMAWINFLAAEAEREAAEKAASEARSAD